MTKVVKHSKIMFYFGWITFLTFFFHIRLGIPNLFPFLGGFPTKFCVLSIIHTHNRIKTRHKQQYNLFRYSEIQRLFIQEAYQWEGGEGGIFSSLADEQLVVYQNETQRTLKSVV
jgi:hypothetical protein